MKSSSFGSLYNQFLPDEGASLLVCGHKPNTIEFGLDNFEYCLLQFVPKIALLGDKPSAAESITSSTLPESAAVSETSLSSTVHPLSLALTVTSHALPLETKQAEEKARIEKKVSKEELDALKIRMISTLRDIFKARSEIATRVVNKYLIALIKLDASRNRDRTERSDIAAIPSIIFSSTHSSDRKKRDDVKRSQKSASTNSNAEGENPLQRFFYLLSDGRASDDKELLECRTLIFREHGEGVVRRATQLLREGMSAQTTVIKTQQKADR